jgi:FMN-dependent NADH-azoreductase
VEFQMAEKERGTHELAALTYSETLIAELETADLIVTDTPMHNFIVPATLKTWVDYVVRPGRTFRNTPKGKMGLLSDRPVFVVIACGGPFSDPSARHFLTPYLHYVLATMALHDVSTLPLENLRRGAAAIDLAEAQAAAWIIDQAASWQKRQCGGCRIS